MANGLKPRVATGYHQDLTEACESALLTLLSAFGGLKTTLRLVGGLVPRYLTPENLPEVPAHAGTSDVDVVLNIQVVAEGEGYAALADQLAERGFERYVNNEGKLSSWRWTRQVGEHTVLIEFLRDAADEQPGRPVSIDGERVSALSVRFAGIAHDWFLEKEINGHVLDGGGISSEVVRFPDVPAFIILKALALDDRQENKDAADLIHVLRYAGKVEDIANEFLAKMHSRAHPEAVNAGLEALRRRFCDDDAGEGYEKVGSVSYAQFLGLDDEEERIREQRYASNLVQELLNHIQARVLDDPTPAANARDS